MSLVTALMFAPSSSADSSSGGGPAASTGSVGNAPGVVQYWGYTPGSGEWQSPVYASTATADHNPGKYVASHPAPRSTSASDPGFSCSLYVPDVWRSGSRLDGETLATCVGSFDDQYVGAQFKIKRWNGWKDFSGVMHSDLTVDYQQRWDWWRSCTGTLSYAYRLSAMQHTSDLEGNWHSGPSVYSGHDYHSHCGH